MKGRNDHFVISRFRFRGEIDKTRNGHFWLSYRTADSYNNGLHCLFFFFGPLYCLTFYLRILITPLSFVIVLSDLLFTDSNDLFGLFKLF